MKFVEFKEKVQERFDEMMKDTTKLYEVCCDKEELWNLYLDSFPTGTNEIFRERREYDCCCCHHFIRTIGSSVAIKEGKVMTLWDLNLGDNKFQVVANALNEYILNKVKENPKSISDIFVTKKIHIGTDHNFEMIDDKSVRWDHFYLDMPDCLTISEYKSCGDVKGRFRDNRNVFKRSLDEISQESVEVALELIAQKTLPRGEEWEQNLKKFLEYKVQYDKLTSDYDKELFAWEKSAQVGVAIGKIRNHSIGTFLLNVSNGEDLTEAVVKYGKVVDPTNFKRPKEVFTQKSLDRMKKIITDLGYTDSLERRFAKLKDITINNVIYTNKEASKAILNSTKADDIFAKMSKTIPTSPKKFDRCEEVSVDDFINKIIPLGGEMELLFDPKFKQNMVSLVTSVNKDSKSMFKWGNNFSWAYTGNVTDSIKENVKNAGGKVDGVLRFSIQWHGENVDDNSDYDAHCIEPNGNEIYYGNCKKPSYSKLDGQLDVDVVDPNNQVGINNPAVENITWSSLNKMQDGTYKFFVNQYYAVNSKGFKAEIEFDGQIYSFEYNQPMRTRSNVQIAEVTLKNGKFSINKKLDSTTTNKETWGINTNTFIPINTIMYSPNYWDNKTVGHKHLFFMLKDCISDETPNGMFNEYLNEELLQEKRTISALGSMCKVEQSGEQLSGIGFTFTDRKEVIIKIKGVTERIIKVKF